MFLCRRLLLRVNTTQFVPHRFLFRRFLSEINSYLDVEHDAGDTKVNANLSTEVPSSLPNTPDDAIFKNAQAETPKQTPESSNRPLLLYKLMLPPNRKPRSTAGLMARPVGKSAPVEVAKYSVATMSDIRTYEVLRKRDVTMVQGLSVEAFTRLARYAAKARLSTVMGHIATDVVENFGGTKCDRSHIAASVIDLAVGTTLLSNKRLHSLLLILESDNSLWRISQSSVVVLVQTVTSRLSIDPSSNASISILLKLLADHLHPLAPVGAAAISHRPPKIVEMTYDLVRNLLRLRRDQQAFDILQVLVDTRNIPPEAIRAMNNTSTSPNYIIMSTLVKSCLHWGWRRMAVDFCRKLLYTNVSGSAQVVNLTTDLLYALLDFPTSTDLIQFSYLFRELDLQALDVPLPGELIRRFFDLAHQLKVPKAVEIVYEHTQHPTVLQRHRYPCPQGRCLTWMLRHLTNHSRNMHLSRLLAKHVVDSHEPIPPQDRGKFVCIAAANGFGLQAVALWERYAAGKNREVVVGNGATMVRMASMLMSGVRTYTRKLEMALKDEKNGINDESHTGPELYRQRLADMMALACRVVAEFRSIKEPLAEAVHYDLTSLARAYFIIGNISAGFDAFKALLDRKEIPDMYDINVALSAMAEYCPRAAAQMIERMIAKGIQPDPISFGSVLHFAAAHGDTELVGKLIGKVRQIDNGQLTLKSVSALIRASILAENTSRAALRQNLERAVDIIRSLTVSKLVCSPNTGKHCIKASLDVDQPLLAFEFWRLLVKRKTEWADIEHTGLRFQIKKRIQNHSRAGWLDASRARVMLHALECEPKISGTW